MVVPSYFWLFLVVPGSWLFLVISGYFWLFLVVLVVPGYFWLFLVGPPMMFLVGFIPGHSCIPGRSATF